METVELRSIDIRLENTRKRDPAVERRLLSSIMERDILDPLEVIEQSAMGTPYLLIDGFKRYRCATRLLKGIVPVLCISRDVPDGILSFLRRNTRGGISTFEEAALLDELHKRCGLSIYDIALGAGRSPAWVSVRLNMLEGLSDTVRRSIISGAFPARAYMYGIKGFTRVNGISSSRVDAFVGATSGKGLSTRDIFTLSRAFFNGGPGIEHLVLEGDIHKALRIIAGETDAHAMPQADMPQQRCIKDLAAALTVMNRVSSNAASLCMDNAEANHHMNYLTACIINRFETFSKAIRVLHDRSRPAGCGADPVSAGSESKDHRAPDTN